ncbi:GDP-mannose 4,6-dehydratase [Ferruginibacter sp. SUN002]|uniref:GDP-mannose 4,6-dehydratase n=1 Tax=Ferruginibacter sp. SUN002 TaxID=2937789 RepID=UPI003D366F5D
MRKILVTGVSGFVSQYLLKYLSSLDGIYEIYGITRNRIDFPEYKNLQIKLFDADLQNSLLLRDIIESVQPDTIIHLASDSSVAYSWQKPIESFQNNTNIFLHLVEAVRLLNVKCRILSIGSSEEYGVVTQDALPLTESSPLNPVSPYAVARVSQEMLSSVYANGYGLDIVMTRSFNHIGSGQREAFVISSFAKQIIELKLGKRASIEVGNVDIVRDFLDVTDVVKAYICLLEKGKKGEVYNVCSGKGYSLKELIEIMMKLAGVNSGYNINAKLIRPSDNPIIIGSNKKIKEECNWQPEIAIEESLSKMLDHWAEKLK